MTDRILSRDEMSSRISVSKMTLYRWVKQGVLPPPVQVGPRRVGWLESQVEEFIASRKPVQGSVD